MEPIEWTGDNGETFIFEYVEKHEHFERPVFVTEVKDSPLATEELPTFFMAVEVMDGLPVEEQKWFVLDVMKQAYEEELEIDRRGEADV